MAKRLILLFTFFIHLTVRSANAHGEGIYTTNVREILLGMDDDQSVWHESEHRELERVLLLGESFQDICGDCSRDQMLSICIKAVHHKWKQDNPTSFTVNPRQLNRKCRITKFYGEDRAIFEQRVYVCPPTTMQISGNKVTEPSFLIGQGLLETQYRVRIFKLGNPATVEGQVTGLSFDRLNFATENKNYVYTPGNDSGNAVTSFRSSGDLYDYRFVWENMSEPELGLVRRRSNIIKYEKGY